MLGRRAGVQLKFRRGPYPKTRMRNLCCRTGVTVALLDLKSERRHGARTSAKKKSRKPEAEPPQDDVGPYAPDLDDHAVAEDQGGGAFRSARPRGSVA